MLLDGLIFVCLMFLFFFLQDIILWSVFLNSATLFTRKSMEKFSSKTLGGFANCVDQNQTVQSDLGQHCLPKDFFKRH